MTKFWELLQESVIVQSLVTLSLTFAVIYLTITGQSVPDALLGLSSMALGYYFGAKAQLTGKQAAKAAIQQLEKGK